MAQDRTASRWMSGVLALAASYNLLWGLLVVVFPMALFDWLGLARPSSPQYWQCIGMMVGVFGVGYAIAASDPLRHWPIVLVGLLGKVLGPISFLDAAVRGDMPWVFAPGRLSCRAVTSRWSNSGIASSAREAKSSSGGVRTHARAISS